MTDQNLDEYKNVIMIVGASSGIGRAVARRLAKPENLLILVARRKNMIDEYCFHLNCKTISMRCDVTDLESINEVFDFLRDNDIKLTGVLYSAGTMDICPVRNMKDGSIEKMFQVNTFGFYNICRYLQNKSFMRNGSSIVVISSYASVTKERGMSAYAASKTALNYMRYLMEE